MVKNSRRRIKRKSKTKNISKFESIVLRSFRKKKLTGKLEIHDMKKALIRDFFTKLSSYTQIEKIKVITTHQMDRIYLLSLSSGPLELKQNMKEHYLSPTSYENIEDILNIQYIGNPFEKSIKIKELLHILFKSVENYKKTCKKEFIKEHQEVLLKIKNEVVNYLKKTQPASYFLMDLKRQKESNRLVR